ncbi:MAG: adenylate/guanylate cyclase domain-containing protein [Acidobacteria bacterium]|nr:adenylate/guanylate cyclase domain-containing protein [Acidobacteriota bacterium]
MSEKEFHYRWEYDLRADPRALWPLVSDTNRFNRDAGLPDVARRAADAEPGRAPQRRLRLSKLGVGVEWDEEPFEWVRPFRFGVVRRYRTGPVAEARVSAELTERVGGGTRLVYDVTARPRGALGRAVIPVQVGRVSARKFAEVFRRYDALALEGAAAGGDAGAVASPLGASERALLEALSGRLVAGGEDAELVARLRETIARGDDLTLSRMRPYALADAWGATRRDVLELFLRATRAGLLDLRWELLCPLCRGPQQTAETLSDVRAGQHCDSCMIDFEVDFDRSVEVVFRPNASVRAVEAREFCVGGPQVTPHVVVQQLVPAGESRTVRPQLEEGRHRFRTHAHAEGVSFLVSREGGDTLTLRAEGGGLGVGEQRASTRPAVTLFNDTDGEQLFVVERAAWGGQAATAAAVTALQLFRDLFASEALRPGDRINVGQMAILFTDLRDSTRLYREIGDAVAFGAVMSHFDVLREEIAASGGSIVKTLGDAVMAVFPRPAPALRAIINAQGRLAAPPAGARPLTLKAGLHSGACIAVTLNGRLDYFGSNVNIAARLEPLSTGADCVITGEVRRDPEVSALLGDPASGLAAEPSEARLKGFDDERFELWRVKRT